MIDFCTYWWNNWGSVSIRTVHTHQYRFYQRCCFLSSRHNLVHTKSTILDCVTRWAKGRGKPAQETCDECLEIDNCVWRRRCGRWSNNLSMGEEYFDWCQLLESLIRPCCKGNYRIPRKSWNKRGSRKDILICGQASMSSHAQSLWFWKRHNCYLSPQSKQVPSWLSAKHLEMERTIIRQEPISWSMQLPY